MIIIIAVIAFYLAAFKWKFNTIIWILVAAAPLVPLLNKICRAETFSWMAQTFSFPALFNFKKTCMKPSMKKIIASFLLMAMLTHEASANSKCGISYKKGGVKDHKIFSKE